MVYRLFAVAAIAILGTGCGVPLQIGEVARVNSPSGRIDAIAIEANTGSPAASSFDVFLVPMGKTHSEGVHVASLYAASRSTTAFGINLKWTSAERLSIEYLNARAAEIMEAQAAIANESIEVVLTSGIDDPRAPAGGMLQKAQSKDLYN